MPVSWKHGELLIGERRAEGEDGEPWGTVGKERKNKIQLHMCVKMT